MLKLSLIFLPKRNVLLWEYSVFINLSLWDSRQAGYFGRAALWKKTLSMVGTKNDEFRALVEEAKNPKKEKAVEALMDFLVKHDVSDWSSELLVTAFFPLTTALQSDKFKLKAYRALDAATPLHDHELCVLLGETLMRDFESKILETREAALHAWLTLKSSEESRAQVVSKALVDPEPSVRLICLKGLVKLLEAAELDLELQFFYADLLQSFLQRGTTQANDTEVSLAIQALSKLNLPTKSDWRDFCLDGRKSIQITHTDIQINSM